MCKERLHGHPILCAGYLEIACKIQYGRKNNELVKLLIFFSGMWRTVLLDIY